MNYESQIVFYLSSCFSDIYICKYKALFLIAQKSFLFVIFALMQAPIIYTQDLVKTFYAGKPNEVKPLQGIDLSIAPHTHTVLKGASGSGKTTLLTLLSCLAKPTSGTYQCMGENISRWSEKFLTRFRQKNIGIIFQQFQLISGMTAYQNIGVPLIPTKYTSRVMNEKINATAELVEISHRLHYKIDTLSGGEKQRVAIARALINAPTLIFADEPTAHLDSQISMNILGIFETLKSQGKTIITTTHDPLVEQHASVDNILIMKDGKLYQD